MVERHSAAGALRGPAGRRASEVVAQKSREGALPPVLVRYFAGLGSFVILDGHYRLQAAIEERLPPPFLVLSELAERTFPTDPAHQAKIVAALAAQQQKNPASSIDGMNQTLINLYDNAEIYAPGQSRAVLGEGKAGHGR